MELYEWDRGRKERWEDEWEAGWEMGERDRELFTDSGCLGSRIFSLCITKGFLSSCGLSKETIWSKTKLSITRLSSLPEVEEEEEDEEYVGEDDE